MGQPRILETLKQPESAAVDHRSLVRLQLEPLAPDEAADYLFHHVRQAGGRPEEIFADETVSMLASETGGNPRRLNQTAHLGLRLAHAAGGEQLDVEAAIEALERLAGKQGGLGSSGDESMMSNPETEGDRPLLILDNEAPVASGSTETPRFLAQPKRPA